MFHDLWTMVNRLLAQPNRTNISDKVAENLVNPHWPLTSNNVDDKAERLSDSGSHSMSYILCVWSGLLFPVGETTLQCHLHASRLSLQFSLQQIPTMNMPADTWQELILYIVGIHVSCVLGQCWPWICQVTLRWLQCSHNSNLVTQDSRSRTETVDRSGESKS